MILGGLVQYIGHAYIWHKLEFFFPQFLIRVPYFKNPFEMKTLIKTDIIIPKILILLEMIIKIMKNGML